MVPLTGKFYEDPDVEEHQLMLALNGLVSQLFDQGSALKPCRMLNGKDWEFLAIVRDNPNVRVEYHLGTMEDSDDCSIWLNLRLYLAISQTIDGENRGYLAMLTPKQTYWICRQLGEEPAILAGIREIIRKRVDSLQKSIEELSGFLAEDADIFMEEARKNKIFDSYSRSCSTDLYTNYTVRMSNAIRALPFRCETDEDLAAVWNKLG